MHLVWPIVRPFLSKRLLEKVQLHGHAVSAIHQDIDPAVLPPQFGGTASEY